MNNKRIIIHAFEKNGRGEEVQISLQWFRGNQYVDMRTWFPDKATCEMRPSQKGLSLNMDQLGDLMAGLAQARALGVRRTAESASLRRCRSTEDVRLVHIRSLIADGLSMREIAEVTGIPRSTVQRLKRKLEAP